MPSFSVTVTDWAWWDGTFAEVCAPYSDSDGSFSFAFLRTMAGPLSDQAGPLSWLACRMESRVDDWNYWIQCPHTWKDAGTKASCFLILPIRAQYTSPSMHRPRSDLLSSFSHRAQSCSEPASLHCWLPMLLVCCPYHPRPRHSLSRTA